MPPGWVTSLDDFVVWVEQELDQAGAQLVEGHLEVSKLSDAYGELRGLNFFRHHLDYRRTDDGRLIWRHDKHDGHERETGGLVHLHFDSNDEDRVRACDEVELADVLDLIRVKWRP